MSGIEDVKIRLKSFKRKYYIRQALIGGLIFLTLSITLFLLVNSLEYQFWLGKTARAFVFFGFLSSILFGLYTLVVRPLLQLFELKNGISDKKAAQEISKSFPEIEDKLENTLQLNDFTNKENDLLIAAIEKKAFDLNSFSFVQAVDFSSAKKYAFLLGSILFCFLLVSFINPSIIKDSSNRLVNYDKDFVPEAPFQFKVLNDKLEGFRGEDFQLELAISGNSIPSEVFIITEKNKRLRLSKVDQSYYTYTFPKIQSTKTFQFEAAGFRSNMFEIEVNERPDLVSMAIRIKSPNYTGGERRTITNSGDISILEGSTVSWKLSALATRSLIFSTEKDSTEVQQQNETDFVLEKRVFASTPYEISLFNSYGKNPSKLLYQIDVIKDQYPKISAEYFPDSTLYQFVALAGSITDDYGFSSLKLNFRKEGQEKFASIPLEINKDSKNQSFYANWNIDTLSMKAGKRLEFYLSVADNDGVNGAKSSKSQTFILQVPSEEEIDEELEKKSQTVENQIDKSKTEAENINERLKNLEEKLKADQKYDWQEKKQVDNIIEDREKLAEEIKQLQKEHEELQKSSEQFKNQSQQLQNKNEQLQELLNELMDEETKKLYEQLKELMKENSPSEQITQQLEKLQQNEQNLEKELERALELFKRLKMESALEQNLSKLDTLSKEQQNLSDQNSESSEKEDIIEKQKDIQEQFENFREKMDKIQELNQELNRPEPMEDFELEERQIAKELREIQEQLDKESQESEKGEGDTEQNDEKESNQENSESQSGEKQEKTNQSSQKQKNASQKMKSLSQKLSKMQSGMQMEMMQANLDQLRDILDNLVKLSFNQEELMTEMRKVNQSDPRFLELSQDQLKLKDDAKVLQDSLLSLAEKVVQISSFITREVGLINDNIDESLDYLKDRNRGRALSSQQFAMTSINNLALLLDDTMQQMQMSMSESMGNQSKGEKKQQGLPDLQEMQNQLGEKMEELKGSGKSGRQLSEELARMAAEQEMIRRQMEMLKEMQDGKPGGGLGGDDLKKAIDMMEQNEVDLVNKRLTQRLINRQKSIQTRMLEAEKAQRQQEMEEERESESPSKITREIPPGFEDYLKLKQKEIELLKTIPLNLNPFYKKEVNDYFRRLSSDEKND